MTSAERQQHAAFTALMWALSRPGRPQRLPTSGLSAFVLIGATLVDLETGYYTPDAELATALAHTGGRALPPSQAPYQLYPHLDPAGLAALAAAPAGTHLDPDLGATLVLGCTLGAGQTLTLVGPGIAGTFTLRVDGLPTGLWRLHKALDYPRGWDLLLVSGDQVVGLPRTTAVEVS
jgi:alpha-D-ribose 1-methylphosphonate 5-triphosphate synthase subunit PhnH